jgi:hypothetical protein
VQEFKPNASMAGRWGLAVLLAASDPVWACGSAETRYRSMNRRSLSPVFSGSGQTCVNVTSLANLARGWHRLRMHEKAASASVMGTSHTQNSVYIGRTTVSSTRQESFLVTPKPEGHRGGLSKLCYTRFGYVYFSSISWHIGGRRIQALVSLGYGGRSRRPAGSFVSWRERLLRPTPFSGCALPKLGTLCGTATRASRRISTAAAIPSQCVGAREMAVRSWSRRRESAMSEDGDSSVKVLEKFSGAMDQCGFCHARRFALTETRTHSRYD